MRQIKRAIASRLTRRNWKHRLALHMLKNQRFNHGRRAYMTTALGKRRKNQRWALSLSSLLAYYPIATTDMVLVQESTLPRTLIAYPQTADTLLQEYTYRQGLTHRLTSYTTWQTIQFDVNLKSTYTLQSLEKTVGQEEESPPALEQKQATVAPLELEALQSKIPLITLPSQATWLKRPEKPTKKRK